MGSTEQTMPKFYANWTHKQLHGKQNLTSFTTQVGLQLDHLGDLFAFLQNATSFEPWILYLSYTKAYVRLGLLFQFNACNVFDTFGRQNECPFNWVIGSSEDG